MKSQENSRRQFLIRGLVSVAALPFAGAMLSATASAAALKPLPANNPQAVALKYVADAKKGVGVKPGSNSPTVPCSSRPPKAAASSRVLRSLRPAGARLGPRKPDNA